MFTASSPSQSALFFPFCVVLSVRGGCQKDNEMKEEENMRRHLCSNKDKSVPVCEGECVCAAALR